MRRPALRASLALGVGIALAAALGGCGSGGGAGGGNDKMVVYSADPASAKTYKPLLDKFGSQNHVKVQLISYPSADFIQNFTSAVNGNSQIDAMLVNGQDVRFFKSKGLLQKIDGLVDTGALQPAAYEPFKVDGGQYAYGIGALNVTAWVYNADILQKHGLTPPKTMDDVAAIAKKLKGTGVAPVTVPGGNIYLWPIWYMQMLQQTTGNKPLDTTFSTLKSGKPAFTDAEYQEAFEELAKIGSADIFVNGYRALQEDAANTLFSDGKAAMFFGGTWDVATMLQQNPKLNVKLVPFPNFKPGVPSAAFGGVGIAAAVYAKAPSDHVKLAQKLVRYMTSAQADTVMMQGSTTAVGLPAVKSVKPSGTSPLQNELITKALPTTVTFLDWYWPKEVTAAFQTDIQAVVGGKKSPKDAAQDVQKAFDDAKSNGYSFK